MKSSVPFPSISTAKSSSYASTELPKKTKRGLNSSMERWPSLFKSAASNYCLRRVAYSFVSFLLKWPAEAAIMNSLKSNLPSVLTSTDDKKD